MVNGRKRPGPPEDSSSSRTKQRFSLPNYPDTRRTNLKKAIAGVLVVLAMFLTPGRGCCRQIARIYLAWVLSSAVFRDVRSCLLCDDARSCWCGWWRSSFMTRLSKIRKKRQPAQIMRTFFHGNPGKNGETYEIHISDKNGS